MIIKTGFARKLAVVFGSPAGNCDQQNIRGFFADAAGGFVAANSGQADVEQSGFRLKFFGCRESGFAVERDANFVTV